MASTATPITLYTNHACPWAQRAEIILAELQIPHEVEIIDLATPRTAEYLAINPRGLVPALKYGDEIIIESGIVANFIADAFPSHLVPKEGGAAAALKRAKIAFFVDTFLGKVQGPSLVKLQYAKEGDDVEALAKQLVENIAKELEPLLEDAKPFFGGSDKLTMAEVQTGSFVSRMYSFPKHGLAPDFLGALASKAPNFDRWAQAVIEHPSVKSTYAEEATIAGVKRRKAKLAEEAAKAKA